MSPIGTLALAVAAVAAVLNLVAVGRGWLAVERAAKPAVIVFLALTVLAAGPMEPLVRVLVLGALAASLVGDVLLLPPGRLMGGLVAFLVAQLAYATAFLVGPIEAIWLAIGVVIGGSVYLTLGRRVLDAASRDGLGPPVTVYLVAIIGMASLATASASVVAAAGAWLFVASDTLLGWGIFVDGRGPGEEIPWRRVAVAATYHAAQLLLVLSFVG